MEITAEELTSKIEAAAKAGAEAAIRAVNTPKEEDRPGGGAPQILIKKAHRPSITKAIRAATTGRWKGAELERDIDQATRSVLLKDTVNEDKDPEDGYAGNSFAWPQGPEAMRCILEQADIKTESPLGQLAVRAMTEGSSSITVTGAGNLVAPQWMADEFVLSLQPGAIVPAIPGVSEVPVQAQTVYMPRETVKASFTMTSEAGTMTASDPTFANQSFTIKKGYAYRQYSNELLADANPALDAYIQKTLKRDMDLGWDEEFLNGDATGNSIYGLRYYGEKETITSGPSFGTNGRTPTLDDLKLMVYNLRVANSEPNFWAMHPRTLRTLSELKDAQGRYQLPELQAPPQVLPTAGTQFGYGSVPVSTLLGYPVYLSSQIPITETAGSNSDTSSIILGNGNFIKLLRRQAIEVMVSQHVAFTTDQTAIRATSRACLAVTQPLSLEVATGVRA